MSVAMQEAIARVSGKHWARPDSRGRWFTKALKRGPSQPYSGPSKRVKARRERRQKGKKGKKGKSHV